ncbi:MAG: hypothetical protein WAP74_04580 [Patescibacteria group bacterium]
MRALVVLLIIAAAAKLPEYKPKPVGKLASPNKQYLATAGGLVKDHKLLFITQIGQEDGSEIIIHGHYDGLDLGRGINHLSWSPNSRYLAFDFLINHSARLTMDGISFIGIIDLKTKKIWLLLPIRGCQPSFLNDKTLEFLSFDEKLKNASKGAPAYQSESSILYRHTIKAWKTPGPRYVFKSDQIIDFGDLQFEGIIAKR